MEDETELNTKLSLTPADLDKDYKSKDKKYPELHCNRSNWTPHRLFKDLFTKGHATIKPNGNYTLVDPTHVCLIDNISVDRELYSISTDESPIKVPDIKLSSVELLRVCESGLVFGNDQGETIIGFTYIIPIIKAFGKPDLIESGPDHPIRLTFGSFEVLIAPRIELEPGDIVTYSIDLKAWLPEFYGIKPHKLNRNQLLDLLVSMDPNTSITEAINYIHIMEVE